MSPDALRTKLRRRPFQPFTIRLAEEPPLIGSLEGAGSPPSIDPQSKGGSSDSGPLSPVGA
jgi:hypothetical protein